MLHSRGALAAALVVALETAAVAQAARRDEALASAYPGAVITAEQVFLSPAQHKQVAALSGSDTVSAFVVRYVATKGGTLAGRAYVDTHTVRTKRESLLVMLDEQARIKRIEVIAFLEPAEYRAPDAWLRQYNQRVLSPDLAVHRAIRPIAGATLTARAANAAVRRVLAIDQVVQAAEGKSRK